MQRFPVRFLRRRLGAWSAAWLLSQVASLSAFLPPVCCAAHGQHATTEQCHEATPAEACPMRAADGTVCPMHRTSVAMHAAGEHAGHGMAADPAASVAQAAEECRLRGTCQGPAVALSTLFSVPGIMPPDRVTFAVPVSIELFQNHSGLLTPPSTHDTPPPKA